MSIALRIRDWGVQPNMMELVLYSEVSAASYIYQ